MSTFGFELYRDDIGELLASGLEIAKECHDKAEIAICLMFAGKNQNRPDFDPASVTLFEESLQYFQDINDQYYVAELNSCLGHHAQAIELQRQIGNIYGSASSISALAWANFFNCNFDEADRFAREAISHLQDIGDLYGVTSTMNLRAINASYAEQVDEARLLNKEVLKLVSKLNYRWSQSLYFAHESLLAIILDEDYMRAQQLSDEAIRLAKTGKVSHLVFWYLVSGINTCALADHQMARKQYREALNQKVALTFEYFFDILLSGMIFAQEGKAVQAIECLSLARHLPAVPETWFAHWTLPEQIRGQLNFRTLIILPPGNVVKLLTLIQSCTNYMPARYLVTIHSSLLDKTCWNDLEPVQHLTQ